MNKIIIDPHYCSREEYQKLKDYLTNKTWDWQEISSGNEKEKKNTNRKVEILKHIISYWYTDDQEIPDYEQDYIKQMIIEGYSSGQLADVKCDGAIENIGWWEIE